MNYQARPYSGAGYTGMQYMDHSTAYQQPYPSAHPQSHPSPHPAAGYGAAGYGVAAPGHPPAGYQSAGLLDPMLLRAARHIYRSFYEAHPEVTQRPSGVALNRYNYRGKLIFGRKPILLPQESFIPLEQIQAELY